jgi:tetratricopeptide (TPR) repeat protein
MSQDPYAPYLRQADDLFSKGELVKAGQIWQAILKQVPQHVEARGRLLQVKQRLLALQAEAAQAPPPPPPAPEPVVPEPVPPVVVAPETAPAPPPQPLPLLEPTSVPMPVPPAPPAPPPAKAPLPTADLDPDRLLNEGCTLFDMGQVEDALRKWELLLSLDPDHRLAREYANGARRDLGLPPLDAPASKVPSAPGPAADEEDIDKLLREAVQLYDIGLTEEAIAKWERVLAADPGHLDVKAYLQQARAELGHPSAAPTAPPGPGGPDPGALDLKLRQADHLLSLQRHEEAAFTFQQALALDPGNARALDGLERCRPTRPRPAQASVLTLDPRGRIAMVEDPDRTLFTDPSAVAPPAALVKAAPAPRQGLAIPDRLQSLTERLPWLREPKVLALIGGGLVVLLLGGGALHRYRKDQALRDAVQAARSAALAPISQQAQAPDLAETPAAIREEAQAALDMDPLRAYLRAATLVRRDPSDAAAARLLEKAKAALPGGAVGASLAEYQNHLQGGDLDAAAQVMDALLRAAPENPDLRARAGRLELALCTAHAAQGKWDDATLDLQRGRALFPDDKGWQARLKLLEQVRAMPKGQRGDWIALLG